MRIGLNALFLIPGGVGGTESYLRRLLSALQGLDSGDELVVYANRENAGTFGLMGRGCREVVCPVRASRRAARIAWEQAALPLQAARDRIDVLHSPGYTAPLALGCASVVTIHDLNYHFHPEDWGRGALWAHRALVPAAARSATRVLTVSHASARALRDVLGVAAAKVDVVHPGVDGNLVATGADDERRVRERYRLPGRFVLAVSASHPHKNLDGLLAAYDRACGVEAPDLVIAGIAGRARERIGSLLATRRGPGRVVMTGWLDPADLAALYRAASLLVCPSRYEGFGFPVLEAMSAGVPVVSSNAASLPEVVGDAALLVDPQDAAAMSSAMLRVLTDDGLRRELVARGYVRAARFSWAAAAAGTLASYRAAARDRGR